MSERRMIGRRRNRRHRLTSSLAVGGNNADDLKGSIRLETHGRGNAISGVRVPAHLAFVEPRGAFADLGTLTEAEKEWEEKRADNGIVPACRIMPVASDELLDNARETTYQVAKRILPLIKECQHCPLIAECGRIPAHNPRDMIGVYGGVYYAENRGNARKVNTHVWKLLKREREERIA